MPFGADHDPAGLCQVKNLYGLFDEARSYLRDSKPMAVVAAYQETFRGVKFYEGKQEPYQEELVLTCIN